MKKSQLLRAYMIIHSDKRWSCRTCTEAALKKHDQSMEFKPKMFSGKGGSSNVERHFTNHHPKLWQSLQLKASDKKRSKNLLNFKTVDVCEVSKDSAIEIEDEPRTPDDQDYASMDVDVEIDEGPSTTQEVLASTSGEFIASDIQDDLEIVSVAPKPTSGRQTSIKESFCSQDFYKRGSAQEIKYAKALTYMFAKDGVADSVLERAGFQYYSRVLCPRYQIPCRQTIRKRQMALFTRTAAAVGALVNKCGTFHLTMDGVTLTQSSKSYLVVTCHFLNKEAMQGLPLGAFRLVQSHTAENLAAKLIDVLAIFNLDKEAIGSITTDGARNMIAAVNSLGVSQIWCVAHILNLTVNDLLNACPSVKVIIDKVSDIVTYFKHNHTVQAELENERTAVDKVCLKLVQAVPTRWNATFSMLERFVEVSKEVAVILLSNSRAPNMLSNNEMNIVEDVIKILAPFMEGTVDMSSQSTVTISKVIPMTYGLLKYLNGFNGITTEADTLKEAAIAAVNKRLSVLEGNPIYSMATILDPRFKKVFFASIHNACKGHEGIVDRINRKRRMDKVDTAQPTTSSTAPKEPAKPSMLWDSVSKQSKVRNTGGVDLVDASKLVSNYCNEPNEEDLNADVINFWNKRRATDPELSHVAIQVLSRLASSVSSERVGSTLNNLMGLKRTRLADDYLSMRLFLSTAPEEILKENL